MRLPGQSAGFEGELAPVEVDFELPNHNVLPEGDEKRLFPIQEQSGGSVTGRPVAPTPDTPRAMAAGTCGSLSPNAQPIDQRLVTVEITPPQILQQTTPFANQA